jgi:hypothetical protein
VLLAADADEHVIQEPFVAQLGPATPESARPRADSS